MLALGGRRTEPTRGPVRAHPGDYTEARSMAVIDGVVTAVGTTLVAVPAGMALANASTVLSPNLLGGGIPALLFLAVAPPLAIAGATTAISNYYEPGAYRLWPSIVFTMPVHWGAMAAGVLAGVWLGNFGSLAVFTIAESVLLPAVSVGVTQAFRRAPAAPTGARAQIMFRPDVQRNLATLIPMQTLQPLALTIPLAAGVF